MKDMARVAEYVLSLASGANCHFLKLQSSKYQIALIQSKETARKGAKYFTFGAKLKVVSYILFLSPRHQAI